MQTMNQIARIGSRLLYVAGIAISLLSMSNVFRLTGVAIFVVLIFVFYKDRRSRCLASAGHTWIMNHVPLTLTFVVVLAFVARIAYFILFSKTGKGFDSFQNSDARVFVEMASSMVNGAFPDTKSWMTTFIHSLVLHVASASPFAGIAIVNFLFQIATAILLFKIGRRISGTISGIFAFTVYLLSPSLILLMFRAIAESYYFLFLAFSFFVVLEYFNSYKAVWLTLIPVSTWLVIWTRGEGVILLATIPLLFVVNVIFARTISHKRAVWHLVFVAVSLSVFACAGRYVNLRFHGTHTMFCSNDNWWPRLFGSNVASKGRCTNKWAFGKGVSFTSDKALIVSRFAAEQGHDIKVSGMHCPEELIPYIQTEISNRWKSMSLIEKIKFMSRKLRFTFANPFWGSGQSEIGPFRKKLLYDSIFIPVLLFAIARFCVGTLRPCCMANHSASFRAGLLPLAYLLGVTSIIAIAEANIRYGVILLVILPLYSFTDNVGDSAILETDTRES